MANTVLIKRSGTANAVPLAGNLVAGELAINYSDGKLYFLGAGNVVTQIAGNSTMSYTGNVTSGNLLTGGIVSATGNILSAGNIIASKIISATDNMIITSTGAEGGQLVMGWAGINNITGQANSTWNLDTDSGNSFRIFYQNGVGATSVLFQANSTSNVLSFPSTAGISAVGNVTGNYFIGNGSQLTGIVASAGASITNGTSNVVVAASGNVTVGVAGIAAVATFTTSGLTANIIASTNNGNGTNFKVGDDTWLGDINLADTLSVRGQQNAANAYIVFGNADGTQLGRAGSGPLTYGGAFSASGNVTGGNLLTAGLISSTGNITGGNISATNHTGTTVSVTANVTGGNILTGGIISATGNVSGGNVAAATAIFSLGTVGASGNTSGGNLTTSGQVSATGNVQGGNLVLTTGNLTLGNVTLNTSNSAILGWSYPNVSLSISASEGTSTGLFFGNAGSSFYVVGTTNDRVYQYNMSSTNMANTGTLFGNVSVTAQDGTPADLFIDSSGANLYILGNTNRVVYQYTLSSPWNITTATYSTLSANISAQEATPNGLWFKPDLTTMYMVGTTNDTVYQYTLTTPGNIATAAYASKSFSVTSQEGTPTAVNLSSDGSKMWILGSAQTAIQEYSLATPWDISTASFTRGNSYSVRVQETAPQGMFVDIANTRVWIVGQTSDTVFQYSTANSIIATANAVGIQGQFQVQGNAYFAEQTVFQNSVSTEGALTVDSTLTGAATVTFSTTTSAINIGTSQTTGATIIGGTAQTANINIGRSTATQGIVIGNGVTSSGNTKIIDIGTLGAANSITNINIGPTAGNANASFLSGVQVSIANTGNLALSVVGNITGGNLRTPGQLTSTLADGTAPFVVTSTTKVVNLNVELVDGYHADTANIVNTIAVRDAASNITAANFNGTGVSVSGNVTGGNVNTNQIRNVSGNLLVGVTSGNLLLQPTGNIILSANTWINNLNTPVADGDAATKLYVDNLVSTQISYHTAVNVASTTTMATTTGGTITYTQPNGAANGVGALLTTTGAFNLIDSANVQTVGTRILVKNEANAVYNGVYTWANATNIVRSTDTDEYGPNSASQLSLNDYFFVTGGVVNEGSAWIVDSPTATITFGTSNISFAQFSQSQVYEANASAGLSLVGTTFSAKVDNNTTAFDGGGNISVKASANLTTPNIGAATGTSLSVTGNITGGNANITGTTAATSKTTGALVVGGGVGVASDVWAGNSVTVDGGAYGNVVITQFASVFATGSGPNPRSIMQVRGADNVSGIGIQGVSSGNGQIYANTGIIFTTGATLRDKDFPTGGATRATIDSTGLSVTGLVSATGNITGANLTVPSGTVINSDGVFVASSAVTNQTVQVSANALGTGVAITTNGITGGVLSSGNIYFKVNSTLVANSTPTGGTVVADIGLDGFNVTGNVYATANITATNSVLANNVVATSLVQGNILSASGNVISGNVTTGGRIFASGNIQGNYFIGNGSLLTGIASTSNAFSTISVAGQSNVVANSAGVVSFVEGSGVTITTDNTTGTVTFSAASSTSIFAAGGSMGLVTDAVTSSQDLGSILDVASTSYDLGTLVEAGLVWPSQFKLPEYTVGTLPTASPAGLMVYVSNASGGAIPAFSDGSNWRRVDDRNIVT